METQSNSGLQVMKNGDFMFPKVDFVEKCCLFMLFDVVYHIISVYRGIERFEQPLLLGFVDGVGTFSTLKP